MVNSVNLSEMCPTKMTGFVTEGDNSGWLGQMSRPQSMGNVLLSPEALVLARSYPNARARVRLTGIHTPDMQVREGAQVIAQVATITQKTGLFIPNPNYNKWDWDSPREIPETLVVAAYATKWALVPRT